MPRISCYISEGTLAQIKELQYNDKFYKSQSQSQFLKKIIDNGLKNLSKDSSSLDNLLSKLDEKITANYLKHTTLCAEILCCVIDENQIIKNKNLIKERVEDIKQRVENYMEKFFTEAID